MKNSKKTGVLLSYINIVLGLLVNVWLTPLLIGAFSDDSYSLYKVMQSFSGPLIMFNLGVSTIVARSVARCSGTDARDVREKENTFAMAILVSVAMSVLVAIVSVGMTALIPRVYGENYSAALIGEAKWIFGIFAASAIVNILSETFKGCLIGHERFAYNYGTQTVRYLLKIVFVLAALYLKVGIITIAVIELINSIIVLAAYMFYGLAVLKERPRLHYFDKAELSQLMTFSLAVFLQAVVNQVNNNVDIIILGAKISEKAVITMYSAALSIYTIYNSMITVFSTVYFPQTAKFLVVERSGKELTDFVIRPGRIQSIVAVAVVLGFAVAGRDFISLWIGERYINAYYVTLMLLIPVTVPLVENVCISILDAKLKRTFRSVVLVIMAAINVVLTLIGVKYYGFWGAAAATVISLVVGHVIIMNIYYKKIFGIEVLRMFREIFRGILPAGLLAAALCIPFVIFGGHSLGWFLAEGCTFAVLYVAFLFLFGMNDYEKKTAVDLLRKILHK